jgi:hypothetical protein
MPPKNPKVKTPAKVNPISEMDKATFAKHMTARHHDSLAGMGELPATIDEPTEGVYRAFHRRLHETRIDLEHEHDKGDPVQHWQDGS